MDFTGVRMNYKKIIKKSISISVDILVYSFLIASLMFAIFSVTSKKSNNGAVKIFNYQLMTVKTGSMEKYKFTNVNEFDIKSIPVDSMIFIELTPNDIEKRNEWFNSLKVGDVLTFNYLYGKQITITHRIVSITEKGTGGHLIELAGDNRAEKSVPLTQVIDTSLIDSPNCVIGKVTYQSLVLGKIVTYLSNPLTVSLCILLPCFVIIFFQIFKIMYLKVQDELIEKEKEIEKLKEQLNLIKNKFA